MTMFGLMSLGILITLAAGMPVAVALGGLGLLWLYLINPTILIGATHAVWNTATNEVLMSVPLFILMGEIIQRTQIAGRFYNAATAWTKSLPGGMLHANIVACAVFSAISGSSVATAATIGTAAIPNLARLGYDRKMTYGSLAAGGTLGILIPPSIPMIIYTSMTEVSLGKLFVAAVFPGIMMVIIFQSYIFLNAVFAGSSEKNAIDEVPFTAKEKLRSLLEMLPIFAIIAVILVSLYFGWATPTEVAGVGAFMGIAVAIGTRTFSFRLIWESLVPTVTFTSMLMLVLMGAQIFAFALFSSGVNYEITEWIAKLTVSRWVILAAIVILYVILGMFVDAISMMVLTLAVVVPIILKLGYDLVWFGIVLVLLLELGLITPPVGMNLFTIKAIDSEHISLTDVIAGSVPFMWLLMLGVLLLILFPEIVLWLPRRAF